FVTHVHAMLKGWCSNEISVKMFEVLSSQAGGVLPIERIIDSVSFVEKSQSPILQLADAFAFVLRCILEEKPGIEKFHNLLTVNTGTSLNTGRGIGSGLIKYVLKS